MNNLVIANNGKAGCGKSSSIKEVFNKLITAYPYKVLIKDGDIKATVTIGNILVGIESQGDPNSRMMQSMNDFVSMGCQIIIAACRTSGETYNKIIELNQINQYDIIWATNDKNSYISKAPRYSKQKICRKGYRFNHGTNKWFFIIYRRSL